MRGAALTAGLVACAGKRCPRPASTSGLPRLRRCPAEGDAAARLGDHRRGRAARRGRQLARGAAHRLERPDPGLPRNGSEKKGNFIPWRVDGHLLGAWTPLSFLEDRRATFRSPSPRATTSRPSPASSGRPTPTGVSGGLGRPPHRPPAFRPGELEAAHRDRLHPRDPLPHRRRPRASSADLSVVFAPRVAVERAFGPVRLLLNVGFRFRQPAGFLNLVVNNELTGGGAVIWALPSGKVFLKPELMFETTFSTPLAHALRRQRRRDQRLCHDAVGDARSAPASASTSTSVPSWTWDGAWRPTAATGARRSGCWPCSASTSSPSRRS